MRLRFREKQSLYHSLGQLLRSGVTFPAALRTLEPSSRGSLRGLLGGLNRSIADGGSVAEAFAAQKPAIGEMESGIVAAVERAGRLDHGLTLLSTYFAALEAASATVKKRLAYPLFILHFGILVFGVQTLMARGLDAYLREVGSSFAVLYCVALVLWLAGLFCVDLGTTSAAADAVLRRLPLVGAIRRNFSVARFCATYGIQLTAGVNVMDALRAAARSSRSGLIAKVVARAVPRVLAGGQVSPLLSEGEAFPTEMLRDFTVGEQTGKLDEELDRLAAEHQRLAVARLETLAEWVPRLIYLGICGYIGYRVVGFYAGYLQSIKDITDQIH